MDKIQEVIIKERKEKNKIICKEYYAIHKEELIKRGCEKVQCELCDKMTSKNNLLKHQKTKLCQRRQKIKAQIFPSV